MPPPAGITIQQHMDAETIHIAPGNQHTTRLSLYITWCSGGISVALGTLLLCFLMTEDLGRLVDPSVVGTGVALSLLSALPLGLWIGHVIANQVRRLRGEHGGDSLVVHLDPVVLQVGPHRMRWGDIDAITRQSRPSTRLITQASDTNRIRFGMDDGRDILLDLMHCWRPHQAPWLVSLLRRRLEAFAPGSPSDVPQELEALRGEPS